MDEENPIRLPKGWNDTPEKLGVIDENTYRAVVRNISQEGENRITITFQVKQPGPFDGWRIYENFDLDNPPARARLVKFLKAVNVAVADDSIVPGEVIGKLLWITIRHRTHQDRIYANVVSHGQALPPGPKADEGGA